MKFVDMLKVPEQKGVRTENTFKSWQCQKCGDAVGWLGRALMLLYPSWHICVDEYKQKDNYGI